MISDRQTWPHLAVTVQLLPWHWRIKPYTYWADDGNGVSAVFAWLGWKTAFGWNVPLFTEPTVVPDDTLLVKPHIGLPEWADPQHEAVAAEGEDDT
jgi:hypothetical protein